MPASSTKKRGNLVGNLYFLPGFIILIMAGIAMHAALDVMDDSEKILGHLLSTAMSRPDLYLPPDLVDLKQLRFEHTKFHIAVIALGLMAFLLYIIAIKKMTALKRLNEENKKYMDVLQNQLAAIEAAGDGIGIVDDKGRLTFMNQALKDIHGIAPENVPAFIGQDWIKLYNDKGQRQITQTVMPLLEKSGTWEGSSPIERKDGSVIMTELSLRMLEDGSLIGTVRDVSERQKAEERRKELEQQFHQAQKMEAIGRLAGGIAHDFNNVLAAINGYAEFLTEDLEDDTPQKNYAHNILKAGQQARKVVDQILAFSRQKQTGKEAFDMLEPLHETVEMLKASLPKTIELRKDLGADHTLIEGNATQISQAIMNLCLNAKDAIDDVSHERGVISLGLHNVRAEDILPGRFLADELLSPSTTPPLSIEDMPGGLVRLRVGAIARGHHYICLRVSDTGSGMSRTIMEHIFEPFFTTKAVDKGTGLGLAMVHGVISSHQGAMVVESVLGKGTAFNLYFPLSENAMAQSLQDFSSSQQAAKGSGQILVVEDQDEIRDVLLEMLHRLGYSAQPCPSALKALEILRQNPAQFDLVLTDQNMPTMTGLELVQQVHFTSPDLPFILVSGYSLEKLQDIVQEHPAIKATLRKPVTREQLAAKIQEVLAEKRKAA